MAPDVLDVATLPETLRYAAGLAAYAERVIVVPKAVGVMPQLPREPWLVVGYSVPTRYGGSDAQMAELAGWPVHLLGGSPGRQLALAPYLHVVSADGNAATRAAQWGIFFDGHRWVSRTAAAQVVPPGPNLPYRAFELSCRNTVAAWRRCCGVEVPA